jgi:hypothetical protein
MNMYGGMEVYLYKINFCTRLRCCASGEGAPGTLWMGGWEGLRTGLDVVPLPDFELGRLSYLGFCSHVTCDNSVAQTFIAIFKLLRGVRVKVLSPN